jgi:hypothetical protein
MCFFEKKKPTNSSAIELRKRRIFCRSIVIFRVFLRKQRRCCKKAAAATTIHSFFLHSLLLIKNIVLRRKMSFFECIHYTAQKNY